MSKHAAKREPKRWLLWCTIIDQPRTDEEYLTERQLLESIKLDLVSGIRATKVQFQALPERKKHAQSAQKKVELVKKPLDNPPTSGGK